MVTNPAPATPLSGQTERRRPWRGWRRRVSLLSTVAVVSAFGVVASDPVVVIAAPPYTASVGLGLVGSFGVLGPAAVGNDATVPATVIRGDLGVGAALTGFPPGTITGNFYTGPTAISGAMTDLQDAYNDALGRTGGTPIVASLSGLTFLPGVHTAAGATGTAASTAVTLDGDGNPDSVFIFKVNGALAFGANTTINLTNGAQAKNVFWQVNGDGALGADNIFVGTMIATTAVTSGARSTVNGRLTSLNGAITLSSTQLYSAPPSVTITGGAAAYTNVSTPVIAGTTSARSPMTVVVRIDGVDQAPPLTPSTSGAWSLQAPPLANGAHTIVARSVDGVGNVGSATQILTVDTTPPMVTIDGGTVAATNDLTPTISGTTDVAPGQVVTLTSSRQGPPVTLVRTALVQSDQTWSISPSGFTAGVWTIEASVSDPAGNVTTTTQTLTIDTTAPVAAITSSALTNDSTPTITGTAEAGTTIAVTIDGVGVAGVVQGTSWSATTATALAHGDHNVSVTATDAVGNSTLVTQTLNVDLIPPLISITPGSTDSSNDVTPTIAGTTDVGSGVVNVSIDGGQALTALVQSGGWNVTPSVGLTTGDHSIVATVTDLAGNVGTATQTLTIDTTNPTVIIDGGPSRTTADATPLITGSSAGVPIGSSVTVAVAGQTLITTITAGGLYSVTAAAITPNGPYVVTVTVTDAAGNVGNASQSLTINAVPPTVTFSRGTVAATNDSTPLISGTTSAPVGSLVVVNVDTQTLNATVQPGGSWNVTAAALATGTFSVVASITDPNGNIGTATQTLTVDSTTPTAIGVNGGSSMSTNDATPTISGTTDAADGRIITVSVAGQTLTVSALAGTWAVTATPIPDGTHTVVATVSATGGNPGSATQSLTIDTVAPIVVIGTGGGTVQTTDPTPAIYGGGATPGSTVTVTVAGQTMTTTVGADGTWTVTPPNPLPLGDSPVTVTIVDPAGNAGTGTQMITVIVEPPPVVPTPNPTTPNPPPAAPTAEYTSVGPKRVFDTRPGASSNALRDVPERQVGGGYELEVKMTDLAGFVPSGGVGAVSMNVTSTGSTMSGYITVYACGLREDVSSVNFSAGKTVANAVIAPVSPDGTVCFFADTATHIIVDVNGWFADGEAFHAVGPKRVFDTRVGASPNAMRDVPKTRLTAGSILEVRVTDLAGFVPADGVAAVSLNVVVTNPAGYGYITVYSCGERRVVSSVNYVGGQTVANAVTVPVSASGTVCFYTLATADLIVDINGWIESGSTFHGVGPSRVLDTRTGSSPDVLRVVPAAKIGGGNVLQVQVTDLPGYTPASGVSAVSLNVTATDTEGPGYITVFACDDMEEVSSVNYEAGATVANAVLAPVSPSGMICLYSLERTHVIVDVNAWIGTGPVG